MSNLTNQLTRLKNAKQDLKTAIAGKGVTVTSSAKLDEYADYVSRIEQGVQLPTLTNPASASQIFSGYQAIDEDGNKITGSHLVTTGTISNGSTVVIPSSLSVTAPSNTSYSAVTATISSGSTYATQIAKGKTILGVTGTAVVDGGTGNNMVTISFGSSFTVPASGLKIWYCPAGSYPKGANYTSVTLTANSTYSAYSISPQVGTFVIFCVNSARRYGLSGVAFSNTSGYTKLTGYNGDRAWVYYFTTANTTYSISSITSTTSVNS